MEVDFEGNLNDAIEVYQKVKRAGKKFATLRCRNSGFPPPDKYKPHYVWKAIKKDVKVGRVKKKKVVREQVLITPMKTDRKSVV